jgi:hypothetical protein
MARYLGSMAVLGLAGLAAAAPVVPVGPTCDGSDGETYTAPTGGQYTIACGTDYAGNDIGFSTEATFADCINACDANPQCIDVSYVGENCYLKNGLSEPFTDRPWVWTAKKVGAEVPPPVSYPTCENNADHGALIVTANGKTFEIVCGVDSTGGDISAIQTSTFNICIEACAETPNCVDVSYVEGNCYLKDMIRPVLTEAAHVWTAKLVDAADRLTCDNNKDDGKEFTTENYSFDIACGVDYAGGDLRALDTPTFEGCLEACDAEPECVNVAYVAPACYLKSEQMPAVANPAVWGAVRKAKTVPEEPVEAVTVLMALYGTQDVTDCFNSQLQTAENGDKWVEVGVVYNSCFIWWNDQLPYSVPKSVAVLYEVGGEQRIWTGVGNVFSSIITLAAGELAEGSSVAANTTVVAQPVARPANLAAPIELVEVVYGPAAIHNATVWENIYEHLDQHGIWVITNDFYGQDPWFGVQKASYIFYRDLRPGQDSSVVKVSVAIETSYHYDFIDIFLTAARRMRRGLRL